MKSWLFWAFWICVAFAVIYLIVATATFAAGGVIGGFAYLMVTAIWVFNAWLWDRGVRDQGYCVYKWRGGVR